MAEIVTVSVVEDANVPVFINQIDRIELKVIPIIEYGDADSIRY